MRHPTERGSEAGRLRELADEVSPAPQLVVDGAGAVIFANREARELLNIAPPGVALEDLPGASAPGELRSQLARALRLRTEVELENVEIATRDAGSLRFDLRLIPLVEENGTVVGGSIVFVDVSAFQRLRAELERSKQAAATAYEHLKSTFEELERINEALESGNQALETINHGLEATNTELQTINGELRRRTSDVERLNVLLETILTSLRVGVAVVDGEGLVTLWNSRATDLWGVSADEALAKPFGELDLGLPMAGVTAQVEGARGGGNASENVYQAVQRGGVPIRCKVVATPLTGLSENPAGAVIVMEELED